MSTTSRCKCRTATEGIDTQAIAVTVSNVNEAPTDLTLSANTVAENAANGTVVGTVTGTDVDAGETKSYTFTNSAGGRFAINRTTGVITVANGTLLNYEAATSHSVTVRVTDRGGLTYQETFTINLTNVNDAPTGTTATVTFPRRYVPYVHQRELRLQRCGRGRQLQRRAHRYGADRRAADPVGGGGDGRGRWCRWRI
jgi:VCBS repeat-containing protein